LTGFLGGAVLRSLCILPDLAARDWQTLWPSDYVQRFVVFSFWIVILLFWFAIRHTGKFRDFVAALFVGGLMGVIFSSTLAQVLPLVDQVIPWGNWPGANVLSWGVLGGILGLLSALLSGRGRRVMQAIGEKFGMIAHWLRLRPLANLLEI